MNANEEKHSLVSLRLEIGPLQITLDNYSNAELTSALGGPRSNRVQFGEVVNVNRKIRDNSTDQEGS